MRSRQYRKNFAVYRHFDKDGKLLYVGKSLSPFGARLNGHRVSSFWFEEIAVVTIQHFSTDLEASVAEKEAIKRERPLYNKHHNEPIPKSPMLVNGMRASLSERERQVLTLLNNGKTISQIAAETSLSVKTVSTYRSRIIEKLNMDSTSTVSLLDKARGLRLCNGIGA